MVGCQDNKRERERKMAGGGNLRMRCMDYYVYIAAHGRRSDGASGTIWGDGGRTASHRLVAARPGLVGDVARDQGDHEKAQVRHRRQESELGE